MPCYDRGVGAPRRSGWKAGRGARMKCQPRLLALLADGLWHGPLVRSHGHILWPGFPNPNGPTDNLGHWHHLLSCESPSSQIFAGIVLPSMRKTDQRPHGASGRSCGYRLCRLCRSQRTQIGKPFSPNSSARSRRPDRVRTVRRNIQWQPHSTSPPPFRKIRSESLVADADLVYNTDVAN